jgi:hypothetical protein
MALLSRVRKDPEKTNQYAIIEKISDDLFFQCLQFLNIGYVKIKNTQNKNR